MSTWNGTPNGVSAVLYGRKCEIVRRSGGVGGTFRAIVEGIDESALRNKGYARDIREGKEIVAEALVAVGAAPPRSPGGASSRYAPHPVELRARLLDSAIALCSSMGLATVRDQDDIARRIAQVKAITVSLEKFVAAAVDGADAPADSNRRAH